jgi:hypothetical protein
MLLKRAKAAPQYPKKHQNISLDHSGLTTSPGTILKHTSGGQEILLQIRNVDLKF